MFWKKKRAHFDYSLFNADMHSHLIPGIDDGSANMNDSLDMIKGLVELGYKKLITTPHIMWDMYKNTREDILTRFEELRNTVRSQGIEVELEIGAEYFLDDHLRKLLQNKETLLSFGENFVLVEFSLASHPFDLKEVLFEMQLQGYQPIIAHPERYVYPEQGRHFFDDLRAAGYLFQLNALSLIGAYGKEAYRQAHYLQGKQWYDFVGTDLHHKKHLEALGDKELASQLKKLLESGNIRNSQL